MHNCCVPGCHGTVGMHRFPKDEGRCQLWMKLVGNPKFLHKTCEEIRRSYRVCERHFAEEDKCPKINPNRYPRLRDNALPVLYLPSPADRIDYNYCCYCAEECASSEIRDK
ncbi:unnamed protein product, partial [Callosobruchus maculatus]